MTSLPPPNSAQALESKAETDVATKRAEAADRLAYELREEAGRPLDRWAVAALLEAKGMRDADAVDQYECENLFEFADDVFAVAKTLEMTQEESADSAHENALLRLLKHLWQGSFFAMPMIGQIICVLVTRYSLWASLDFTELQATVVGLGTLGSFTVTGGLVMCIGRQGTVYKGLQAIDLLRKICFRLMIVGSLVIVGVGVVAFALQMLTPLVSMAWFWVALAYYGSLSVLWLALAMLYMLGQHQYSFGLTFVGGILVAVLVRGFGAPVVGAQLGCILLTAVGAFFVANRKMAAMSKGQNKSYEGAVLAPLDVLTGTLYPFFVYGSAYFTLLFADRAMAWTAPGRPVPAAVWFHTPYELGMDWGLISLLVPMTYLEHVVYELAPEIESGQKNYTHAQLASHRRKFLGFFWKSVAIIIVLAAISVVGSYFAVLSLKAFDDVATIRDFFASPITFLVYWLSASAYQLLTIGLLVGLLHFTLGRHEAIVREMNRALFVSVATGFLVSRIVEPHYAAAGFLAAMAVFAAMMLRAGQHLSRNIDHVYFSAF